MIDSDDADTFLLLSMFGPGGWIGFIIAVIGIVVAVKACANESECSERHCDHGKPKLIKHECLCVEGAKP